MSCIAWVYRKCARVCQNFKTDLVGLLLWRCNANVVVFEITKMLFALGINFSQLEQERGSEREGERERLREREWERGSEREGVREKRRKEKRERETKFKTNLRPSNAL